MNQMGGMNVGKLMKQAQQMQKQMAQTQEELKERVVEATAGGGMVTVKVNGAQELLDITIDTQVVDPEDKDLLEDMVTAAVNEGMKKAKELADAEMAKVTGGMNLPGMF
jgi:DNA-binding YbaB/EbfC family protein